MSATATRQTASGNFGASRRASASQVYDDIVHFLDRGLSVQNVSNITGASMEDVARIRDNVRDA